MRLIYTMHMPLFMGICGYFFCKSVHKYDLVKLYISHKLLSRLLGLCIPMITFGLLKVLVGMAQGKQISGAMLFMKEWFYASKGIWFLGDLGVNTVIVVLVLLFCKGTLKHDWKYFLIALPLTVVPYITYKSPHMYLYFVLGYWAGAYLHESAKHFLPLWKYALPIYILAYAAFCNMPWPPEDIWYDYHHQTILQLAVNDGLKVILGITGSFLVLVLLYHILPHIQEKWLYRRAIVEGRFTLDIYLLQILLVEMIFGNFHKTWVAAGGIDLFNFNFLERTLATLIMVAIFMEILVFISKLINRNRLLPKVLFFRSIKHNDEL